MNQVGNDYPFNLIRDIYGVKPDDNTHTGRIYLDSLYSLLGGLSEKHQHYIKLRYQQSGTRKWCGEQLGMTEEQARQAEAKILRSLRRPESTKRYEDKALIRENKELWDESISLLAIIEDIASGDILPEEILFVGGTVTTIVSARNMTIGLLVRADEISIRTYNCLRRAGYQTLDEITSLTKKELLALRGVGKNTLAEIKDVLHHYGLSLKPDYE